MRNTLGLVNASLEDALRFGGELTRAAIGAMELRHDRKYIVVDTKVHMLMPGFYAAIPGWHTDGVPRGRNWNPLSKEDPRLDVQEAIDRCERGDPYAATVHAELAEPEPWVRRPTRYHMLVTGDGCLTEFVDGTVALEPTPAWAGPGLYADMNRQVEVLRPPTMLVPSCRVVEFDWWDIHRGTAATMHEWRFFIRVAELDLAEPERDLRKVIRTQCQVYTPTDFGW